MSGLRRSARIKDGPEVDYTLSKGQDENYNSSDQSDEEGYVSGEKRQISKHNNFSSNKKLKKGERKMNRQELEENFKELSEEFTPTKLFTALAFESTGDDEEGEEEEFSVNKLVNNWLDSYEDDSTKGRKEIINLILNCCGALILAEDHDVNDTTTAETTVAEFEIFFEKQAIFEYYLYHSKNNDKKSVKYKNLYKNFRQFFKELIVEADNRGLIAIEIEDPEEDDEELTVNPLIFDLLIWFSKFGSSKINPFRLVSTIALYEVQSAVIQLIPAKNAQTQSLSNMITKEEKKKRSNKKAIDNWNEKLQSDLSYINVLKSIVDDSLAACFEHRVRDTDEAIRSISINYLEKWIEILPSKFYHANYLKCFGWLLTDISPNVRSFALLSLTNTIKFVINKNSNIITPLEAFCKKYIFKIIDIVITDKELECRILAGEVINLVNEIGWLSDKQSLVLSSLIFMDSDNFQIRPTVGAKNKESRFLSTISKIFFSSENSKYNGKSKRNQTDLSNEDEDEISDSDDDDSDEEKNISMDMNVGEKTVTSQNNAMVICEFISFFLDAFTCFVAVSTGVSTYETFEVSNSQIEIETFESYQEIITQAMEFLSVRFKSKLVGLAKFITNKDEISKDEFSQLKISKFTIESLNKTDLSLILLNGFCKGLYEQKKNSSDEFAPYVVQFLPQIFKEYMTTSATSNQIDIIVKILSFFTHDQFSSDDVLDAITSTCQKAFLGNMIITNDDIMKKNAFTSLFAFYAQNTSSKYSSYWTNEIQILLDKTITYMEKTVFVESKKYPDTNFDVFTKELFLLYVNKLVILVRFFNVDIPQKFWKLFEKTVSDNVIALLDELKENNVVSFEIYFVTVLKIALGLQSNVDQSNFNSESSKILTIYNKMKSLFSQLYHIEYDSDVLGDLRLNVGNTLLDIKLVYESTVDQISLQNDNINPSELIIGENVFDYLKETFIYQETKVLNESTENIDQNNQELLKLSIFVLKIKNLLMHENINMQDSSLWQRILLKKERLGSDYFAIIS